MSFLGHDSRVRVLGQRLFYQFGLHCATHQIRLILVSAIVITSLFYPALAIYSSSQPQFLAPISSRILESVAGEGLSSHHIHHDLHDPWSGYDTLHIREDSVARARCGTEGILRVERLLIHSALPEDAGALNNQILLSTLQLERQLGHVLSTNDMGCLRRSDGTCFVLSPVAFWNYDEERLLLDEDVLDTLQRASNISIQGIPITPQMVLAGRELDDNSNLDFAMFLAFTYVFHETSCLDSSGHSVWVNTVRQTAGRFGDLATVTKEPTLLALEYKGSKDTRSSALYTFTWLAYFVLLVYAYRMSRTINNVHSRLGVAFTGVIEILVSTITSLSVCALAGFKITMIPWEFFPVLITFVGIENMFALVDAIYSTPITLPVKDRVAKGLSRAGTSNTLKCCAYNSILGVIAGLSGGAIRQFCAFAVAVLVAHWFLVHTFFVTVLSIDLQRLELEELLQQAPDVTESDSESRKPLRMAGAQNLKGRANKNSTLLLLLAITGILYYSTQRAGVSDPKSPLSRGALSRGKHGAEVVPTHSPASSIWRLFNPNDDPLVHLRMEAPTVLMLRPDITQSTDRTYQRPRFSVRTIRRLIWVLKIFFAPILATVGLLYGLLLYLLRDAQLLDARHDRPNEGTSECTNTEPPVDENVSFTTLPRAFSTDVELIATSNDGRRVAAIGAQNELTIWNMQDNERKPYAAIDATDLLTPTTSTLSNQATVTALTISGDGLMCAIGTGVGMVLVWSFGESDIVPVPQLSMEKTPFSVTGLQFSAARSPRGPLRLLATYDNGAALEWWTDGSGRSREITPSRLTLVSKCGIVPSSAAAEPVVAFSMEDGTLELCGAFQEFYPTPDFCVAAGNPSDLVFQVHATEIMVSGQTRSIVAAATRAGVISIWDWETGECITILDDRFGETSSLRLSPVKPKKCQFCGEMVFDSFLLSFSVGQTVIVYRAYLMEGSTRKCSCPQHQPQRALNVGVDFSPSKKRRSRQSSVASSGNSSPRQTRSRHPSLSGTTTTSGVLPTFPVSGHGIHSRRVSEKDKDSLRRAVELMVLPIPSTEDEDAERSPPRTYTSLMAGRSRIWENLVVVKVAVTNFERGKWEVVDEKVVGLRRRPLKVGKPSEKWTVQVKPGSASGLSPASLERWELWTFDPLVGKTQVSSLASLRRETQDDALADSNRPKISFTVQNDTRISEPVPRLPFTRVSSFLCRGGRCLAGFGNTIGVLTWETQPSSRKSSLS